MRSKSFHICKISIYIKIYRKLKAKSFLQFNYLRKTRSPEMNKDYIGP